MPTTRVDFKHVRAHASFEAVAAHYSVSLLGKGEQRSALCTFHEEDTPSLKINLAKKIFHCFGCKKSGNILEFVTYMEGGDPARDSDLRSAAVLLAEICNIDPLPQRAIRASATKQEKPSPRARTERTSRVSHFSAKPEAEPVRENKPLSFELKLDTTHSYLKERGLTSPVIESFGLGFADRGLMKGRLAIPIHNEDGALIAYAGRWAQATVPQDVSKYLLPPRFAKGLVLFNLNRIPSGTSHVVMVESFFSVFRLHERGIPAVSPMGHDVSPEQCALLKRRGVRMVTVLFDGDTAGADGTARTVSLLAGHLFVHAPVVPLGFRPDACAENELGRLVQS